MRWILVIRVRLGSYGLRRMGLFVGILMGSLLGCSVGILVISFLIRRLSRLIGLGRIVVSNTYGNSTPRKYS